MAFAGVCLGGSGIVRYEAGGRWSSTASPDSPAARGRRGRSTLAGRGRLVGLTARGSQPTKVPVLRTADRPGTGVGGGHGSWGPSPRFVRVAGGFGAGRKGGPGGCGADCVAVQDGPGFDIGDRQSRDGWMWNGIRLLQGHGVERRHE
jgi:hypothetical protein